MSIEVDKQKLTKRTAAEVLVGWPGKFFVGKQAEVGPVPADTRFCLVALAVTNAVGLEQQDALEAAIEAIDGVTKAKVAIYGTSPSEAETPAGWHFVLHVQSAFIPRMD